MTMIETRQPEEVDAHVGRRIRQRRRVLGQTQTDLAQSLGLTFQQVQKYERGANRVSASKLYQVALAQGTRPEYYFKGLFPEPESVVESAEPPPPMPEGEVGEIVPVLSPEKQAAMDWLNTDRAFEMAEMMTKVAPEKVTFVHNLLRSALAIHD